MVPTLSPVVALELSLPLSGETDAKYSQQTNTQRTQIGTYRIQKTQTSSILIATS